MRALAPFTVLLAQTGRTLLPAMLLGLLPLPLLAGPMVKRYVPEPFTQRTAPPPTTHTHAPQHPKAHPAVRPEKPHAVTRHPKATHPHAHPIAETLKHDEAASARVHSWVAHERRIAHRSAPATSEPHRKATSADFLKAANVPESAPPAEAPKTADVATPVSVISPIRRSAEKPQLPPVEDLVSEPVILPTLYNKRGRLVVPPPLKGSHEILIHQNQVANDEGLDRIRDDDDLQRMRDGGLLVAIPVSSTLHVDERLPANRRYCRPWTALFLETLARQHYAHFQTPLQVNSAVRTVEFQQRLIHTNGNAAPAEGDTASPHLTGQAIDIAKHGLSMAEIAWLRGYLLPLVQQGKVDVEEEFQQSCFHISVYKKYLPQDPANRRVIATTHREGMGSLATSLR